MSENAETTESKSAAHAADAGAQSGGDEEKAEGAPAWMATFADMVTLLMCFFVLLFAMSSTQEESFKELIKSLRSALGVQQVPEAGTREGLMMQDMPVEEVKTEAVDEAGAMVQKEIDEIVSDVRELVMFNQLGGLVKVEGNETGATITISDMVLFAVGESHMKEEGLRIMRKIADVLSQFRYMIKIVGHTDNSPINTVRFPSNWELSAARASEVVRFLAENGIDPKLMAAVGYSEYHPIASNDTDKGRAQNRRVEIVYERQSIMETVAGKAETSETPPLDGEQPAVPPEE